MNDGLQRKLGAPCLFRLLVIRGLGAIYYNYLDYSISFWYHVERYGGARRSGLKPRAATANFMVIWWSAREEKVGGLCDVESGWVAWSAG